MRNPKYVLKEHMKTKMVVGCAWCSKICFCPTYLHSQNNYSLSLFDLTSENYLREENRLYNQVNYKLSKIELNPKKFFLLIQVLGSKKKTSLKVSISSEQEPSHVILRAMG